MRVRIAAVAIICWLVLGAPAAYAVTSWLENAEVVIQADAAITPADLTGKSPDAHELDDTLRTARPLRVGKWPEDRVIVAGDQDWYELFATDGPGYVRIGATGPIDIIESTGDTMEEAGSSQLSAPRDGTVLVESVETALTQGAIDSDEKHGFMRITTKSTTPVAYRISFVAELPDERLGGMYGPGVAAEEYIDSVAVGDPRKLREVTGVRYSQANVTALRKQLFGTSAVLDDGFNLHSRDASADPDVEGERPVQHLILSSEDTPDEGRHWAFMITCESRNGLWIVTDARRDPSLSDAQLSSIIERDFERDQEATGFPRGAMSGAAGAVGQGARARDVPRWGIAALFGLGCAIGVGLLWRYHVGSRRP